MAAPRVTKKIIDILSDLYISAEASGFREQEEINPETFTTDAIEATEWWLTYWNTKLSQKRKKRK